jgi:hypothetical protein
MGHEGGAMSEPYVSHTGIKSTSRRVESTSNTRTSSA